ncbi:hypothetical protein ACIBQ0_09745 [Nocardia nova]|uniref:hypothetical protein n=1 Tax=Nocardia nova TaxID=37330 RepID=UPI0037A619CC
MIFGSVEADGAASTGQRQPAEGDPGDCYHDGDDRSGSPGAGAVIADQSQHADSHAGQSDGGGHQGDLGRRD